MEIWNTKNLPPPPVYTCKSTTKEIDVRLLSTILKEAVEFFEDQKHLCIEAALLSRIIYRMKMKFRSSKDFKAIERLNHCLLNYLQMDVTKPLKGFLQLVPMQYKRNKTYLPTKNMMHYVLVRLQGLGKLLVRAMETCKIMSKMCYQRMRLGHFWKIAVIINAATSRIFVICKKLIQYSCDLYSQLLSYSTKLCNPGTFEWLPEGYRLPEQLNKWLEIDWIEGMDQSIIEVPDDEPMDISFMDLVDDDDSDDDIAISDEYILIRDLVESSSSKNVVVKEENDDSLIITESAEQPNLLGLDDKDVDIGEVINLDDTAVVSNEDNSNSSTDIVTINLLDESNNESVILLEVGKEANKKSVNNTSRKRKLKNQNNDSVIIVDDKTRKKRKKKKNNHNGLIKPATTGLTLQERLKLNEVVLGNAKGHNLNLAPKLRYFSPENEVNLTRRKKIKKGRRRL